MAAQSISMIAPIYPEHAEWLAGAGFTVEQAKKFGTFSAHVIQDIFYAPDGGDPDVQEQAQALAWALPGVVFPWHALDGSVTLQLRPDNAPAADSAAKPAKYLSAKGRNLGIDVPAMMRDHIDTAKVLLIVEGTKQHIMAALNAPDDTLVVGLPGIQGWSEPRERDEDGAKIEGPRELHGDLADLVAEDTIRTVIVVPDADWRSNGSVMAAVRQMVQAIEATGDIAKGRVKVADLASLSPAETKDGLDDILSRVPEAERPGVLTSIMKGAKVLPRPKTPRMEGVGGLIVDTHAGVIKERDHIDHGETVPGDIALGAAARIVRTRTTIDPGTPDDQADAVVTADIEVIIGSDETVDGPDPSLQTRRIISRVPDAIIDDPRAWLGPRLGGVGQRIAVATSPSERKAVGNTIRTASLEVEDLTEVSTVGYWTSPDGERFWIPGRGPALHLVDGRLTEDPTVVGATPSGMASAITIHAEDATTERIHEAGRLWASLMDDLDWTPAACAAWGYAAAALSGYQREGREERPGIMMLAGRPGSGKTEIAHGIMSLMGREFASQSGLTFRATDGALGAFDDHMQPGTLTMVDDYTGRVDRRQDQAQIMDDMARKTYDGASRPRQTRDGRGGYSTVAPRRDQAMLIVTGERQPSSITSALERMLVLTVPHHPWDAGARDGDGAAAFSRWSGAVTSGALEPLGAALVSDGLEDHADVMERVAALRDWLHDIRGWDMRPRQMAAPILMGLDALMVAADVSVEKGTAVFEAVCDAIEAYWCGISDDATSDPTEAAMDALRGAVASGRFVLEGASKHVQDRPGTTTLGFCRTTKGQAVVCLIPSVASQILGQSTAQVGSLLRSVVMAGEAGRPQRKIKIDGQSMRFFVIPEEIWSSSTQEADDEADPLDIGDEF